MPVKPVNKPRAELLWEVFGGRAWNVEERTWRHEEVAGEEEQGSWFLSMDNYSSGDGNGNSPQSANLGEIMALRQKKPDYCRIKKKNPIISAYQIFVFLSCVKGIQLRLCVDHRANAAMAQQLSLSSQKLNFLLVFHYSKLYLKFCGHSNFNHLPDFTM